MLVSEIVSNHMKELAFNFWKICSAFTRRMARIKKLKIPAEIYVTLISSQWDLVLAFCQLYTYIKSCLYDFFRSIPSQGVECYYFLSMDCQKKKRTVSQTYFKMQFGIDSLS